MNIIFRGDHSTAELADSLISVLKLLREHYGINNYRDFDLQITLLDKHGEKVDLVDAETFSPINIFEIYKDQDLKRAKNEQTYLNLVVDNTTNDKK